MPPRRDPSPSPNDTSALTSKIDQLITSSNTAATDNDNSMKALITAATHTDTRLKALITATENLSAKISLNSDTTTMLVNNLQRLTSNSSPIQSTATSTLTIPPLTIGTFHPANTSSTTTSTIPPNSTHIPSQTTSPQVMLQGLTNYSTSSSAYTGPPLP